MHPLMHRLSLCTTTALCGEFLGGPLSRHFLLPLPEAILVFPPEPFAILLAFLFGQFGTLSPLVTTSTLLYLFVTTHLLFLRGCGCVHPQYRRVVRFATKISLLPNWVVFGTIVCPDMRV